MLIYNSKKEFLGIDEADLKSFGFNNLADLQTEAANFEDLFLRTPGFIHNFKYVHWIDYILHGGSIEKPKAILRVNNQDYMCNLSVTTAFMSDSPSSKAYMVHLQNIRVLTKSESLEISDDLSAKASPSAISLENSPPAEPVDIDLIKESIAKQNHFQHNTQESVEEFTKPSEITVDDSIKVEEVPDIDEKLDLLEEPITVVKEAIVEEIVVPIEEEEEIVTEEVTIIEEVEEKAVIKEDEYHNDYVFDPQVASDELGLPIDLIEEFIEDFIAQAKEFKEDLYKAVEEEDINNLRILSHKLKGVAANLRIEDALEVLTIANTSDDLKTIKTNLNYLYIIIAKLDSDEKEENIIVEELSVKDEDEFVLDFKDDDNDQNANDDGYNKAKIANDIGIDIDTFNDLFNDYILDAEEIIDAMDKLIVSNDLIHLKKHVVKLQGMNRNMRIENFSNELQILIDTPNQDVAAEAINKINSVISSMKA